MPFIVLGLLLLTKCTSYSKHPQTVQDVRVATTAELVAGFNVLSELEELGKQTADRHVWIVGPQRIILPSKGADDAASEHREYTFDVRADKSGLNKSLQEALDKGDIEIDVFGAKARIEPARYERTAADGTLTTFPSQAA